MWDRRFLFSDDRLISRLKDFVPMVGNTHDLQNHRSSIGEWFIKAVSKVNPRVLDNQTSQGFYVLGADGSAYVFNNNRSVDRVLDALDRGMKSFRASPPSPVEIPEEKQWTPTSPAGALVLRVYSRIKPVPSGSDPANENVQRDHLWILPSELEKLKSCTVPEALVMRLCRFTLVDSIRGEPDFWTLSEIVSRKFTVDAVANRRVIRGSFEMKTGDSRRGLSGSLELHFDPAKPATAKGIASTTAWGQGTYTPNPPKGKFALGFAFVFAPARTDTVAPQAAMFGREYLTGE